jgi:hypothetical protein
MDGIEGREWSLDAIEEGKGIGMKIQIAMK